MTTKQMSDHNIQGVCFDLDGVLVDAAEWHKIALDEALISFGYEAIGEEEHIKTYNGLSTYRKLEMLGINKRIHDAIYQMKQVKTIDIINERCVPIPRVRETVAFANFVFAEHSQRPGGPRAVHGTAPPVGRVAVVTNCSRKTAELMLEKSGLLHLFKFLITNEDVDGKIKPHPRPYLMAQRKLGITGQKSVLAIDDTGRGIISAVEARCRTWFLKSFEDLTPEALIRVLDSYRNSI